MNYPTVITKEDSERYRRSIQSKEWIPLPAYVLTATSRSEDRSMVSRIEIRYQNCIRKLKRKRKLE